MKQIKMKYIKWKQTEFSRKNLIQDTWLNAYFLKDIEKKKNAFCAETYV